LCSKTDVQQIIIKLAMGLCISRDAAFLLGPENAKKGVPDQGWQFETEVREATIKAAGNGRFALKTFAKGPTIIEKNLKPMSSATTLVGVPNNTTFTFKCTEDLEKYITLAISEGGYTRQEILTYYEHFMYGFDGVVCCLNVSTWTVNHAGTDKEGLNIRVQEKELPDGTMAYEGICVKDVKVDDELYMDYRRFKLPDFYVKFTDSHGFGDVRKNTLIAVYGSDAEAKTGKHGSPWVPSRKLN